MKTPNTTNDYPAARCESLPRCLRHVCLDDAKMDAMKLLALLDEWVYRTDLATEAGCGLNMTQEVAGGLALVLNLLRDKLDILWGDYRFPLNGCSDQPDLAERVTEGGDA